MKFERGDRVRLLLAIEYGDVRIPAGATGTIDEIYPATLSYDVAFDGLDAAEAVLEIDLEAA